MQVMYFFNYCIEGLVAKLLLPKATSAPDFSENLPGLANLGFTEKEPEKDLAEYSILNNLALSWINFEDDKFILILKSGDYHLIFFHRNGLDYVSFDIIRELPALPKDSPQYGNDFSEMKKILTAIVKVTKLKLGNASLEDEKMTERIKVFEKMYREPDFIDESKLENANCLKPITTKIVQIET